MAQLQDKAKQFEPIKFVTRDTDEDPVDEVEWTVHVSVLNEMRLRGTVQLETDLTTGISKTAMDVVKAAGIGLDCVVGWTGVTRTDDATGTVEPMPFARALFEALPRAHIRAFIHAWCVKAMTDEFPLGMVRGMAEAATASGPSEGEEQSPEA